MKATEQHRTTANRTQTRQPFFNKTETGSFFSETQEKAFFDTHAVQPKLTIGPPDDPYEREADAMAEKVVRDVRPDRKALSKAGRHPAVQSKCVGCEAEEGSKLRRQEDEEMQAKLIQRREEEEEMQAKLIQRQEEEEEPVQAKLIQRQEEKEEPVQAKRIQQQEEEEEMQAKLIQRQEEEEPIQTKRIQRQEEEEEAPVQAKSIQRQEEEEEMQAKPIQRMGQRDYPEGFVSEEEMMFNQPVRLKSNGNGSAVSADFSKRLKQHSGNGRPLASDTQSEMESAFSTDFSNVRVHTGTEASKMSSEIGAKAFTIGRDVYFNDGQFNSKSTDGRRLLAHELTHTVQQGASARLKRDDLQRQEEGTENLAEELAESKREAVAATDPMPAKAARSKADKQIAEAKEVAKKKAPAKKSASGDGEAGKQKPRVVQARRRAAEEVMPTGADEEQAPKGIVGQELDKQSENVCSDGAKKAQKLSDNERAHDPAAKKLGQTEEAVVPPEQEGQSRSNASQVETVETAEEPKPDPEAAKATLNQAIEASVPSTVKAMNEFKSQGKAKVIGNTVLAESKKEVGEIQGTYEQIEKAPPPPPAETPTPLPPPETAPNTPKLDLGKEAVPPLKPEHTDEEPKKIKKGADDKYAAEGVTRELVATVDSGDLAEANEAHKELDEKVAKEPAQVRTFAAQEQLKVKTEMQQEEAQSRTAMRQKRDKGLGDSQKKQEETKSDIEKKREAVTKQVNEIYEKAKTTVKEKLSNLEQQSLQRFDAGQTQASDQFEREVNRDINAWKDDRYSGLFGGVKWVKDKLVGIDGFPEVKRAFTRARERYVARIDKLILKINADNERAIEDCKKILADANKEIKAFVDKLDPDVKAAGQKAMNEMKKKLAEMGKFIDQKKKELQQKLCDKKEAAIKAIDKKIEQMKSEMGGLLGKLGNLLLQAALKFFKWALEKIGVNPQTLLDVINKGASVLKKIIRGPIQFIGNLVKAVKGGISQFVANIKKHLLNGLVQWLTGAMGNADLQLPEKFDLRGVLSLVLQVLGLTWANLRQKLVKKVGEKVMAAAETTVDIIKRVKEEGPIALWTMIKGKAGEIKNQVMEGIRNWVITQVVKNAVVKLASMLNPAGAIVQAILAIWKVIKFFIDNMSRIVEMVKSIFNSITEIASGAIGKAANFIEQAMARSIPLILSFLGRLIGLSGVGKAVKNVIQKVRRPIDKVVGKAINFIATKVKKLLKKGKKITKDVRDKIVNWWKSTKKFKGADGKSHKLSFKGERSGSKLMISSNPRTVDEFLADVKIKIKSIKGNQSKSLNRSYRNADKTNAKIKKLQQNLSTEKKTDKRDILVQQLKSELARLSTFLQPLVGISQDAFPSPILPPSVNNVKASGFTAEFINKDVPIGTEAGSYDGATLQGWKELQDSGLTKGSKYVKMHLLPHKLGGNAVDSNLVPAPGPSVNSAFSKGVEQNAINAKSKGIDGKGGGDVIWYKLSVSYHKGESAAYPSKIAANWGTYNNQNGNFTKAQQQSPYTKVIDPPFKDSILRINDLEIRAVDIKNKTGIPTNVAQIIISTRSKYGSFLDLNDLLAKIKNRYEENKAAGKSIVTDFSLKWADIADKLGKSSTNISYKRSKK